MLKNANAHALEDTIPSLKEQRAANNSVGIDGVIELTEKYLHDHQFEKGYWQFELEADCTIPAEYILMMHYLGDIDDTLQKKIAVYLRRHQNSDGSYPLFSGGLGDLSCTTKVYYALKLAGDDTNESHMKRARRYILSQGGAAHCNVFTRIALATFNQVPWRAVPYIPVEIMHLPKWFVFHLDKVAYWSRTVMVPLFILCTLKAEAKNPLKIDIRELFTTAPELERHYFQRDTLLRKFFLALDHMGRAIDPFIPKRMRNSAMRKAENWFTERLNGEDGLGAIFPAMVNAYEALLLLGIPEDDNRVVTARKAIDKLLVIKDHEAYCQPCFSPVWDTGLASLALQEAGNKKHEKSLLKAFDWLASKQLKDEPGDWQVNSPNLAGGGWPFQFENPHYPDVDDTAVVGFAMAQQPGKQYDEAIERAANWIAGMQSSNGGFGAFDIDNTHYHLNSIPFADHGALLDPPTVDVSARCAMFLAKVQDRNPAWKKVIEDCVEYIRDEQESDGSWFGRWGTNFIYGTWSTLIALEQIGIDNKDPMVTRAIAWLKSVQRSDGGWGEDNHSYHDLAWRGRANSSTSFQTAWALLGLMAAGEVHSETVKLGVDYLVSTQKSDGSWEEDDFTAPGFPKVFYLKYHGYNKFFPLWALARYRNLTT